VNFNGNEMLCDVDLLTLPVAYEWPDPRVKPDNGNLSGFVEILQLLHKMKQAANAFDSFASKLLLSRTEVNSLTASALINYGIHGLNVLAVMLDG
jgi:hypothetical protein